jgi:CsoR family transcriptional regulator, copper-sensing transcriptional repressor
MSPRSKLLTSYRKAKSLLETIERMIEEDAYCIDIMQQNLAVMGLLRSAHTQLMERHLHHCFRSAMESGSEKKKRAMIEEMLTVTHLSQK